MDCNKEEAARATKLAEEKMSAGDFVGAHKLVTRAQRLFPNLENILQMIAICDVHSCATKKINGLDDWYGVLQVQPLADDSTIKKQYRKLTLLLHPDKNKFAGAETAFKLVGEANRLLADPMQRSHYDFRYTSHSVFATNHSNSNSGGPHCAAADTFRTCCKNCGHGYTHSRAYINLVMHCSICKKSYNIGDEPSGEKESQVQEPETGAATSVHDLSDYSKKRRQSVEELIKNFEADGFYVAGANTDADEYIKRKKQQDPNAEHMAKMDEIKKSMDEQIDKVSALRKRQDEYMDKLKKRKTKNVPDHHRDPKVRELAILWKGKIRTETPRSSPLDVLAFLHFIVTSRLHNSIINQEETAQLASYIAHLKQAPTLFQSLGLNHLIPEFVEKLINTRDYIPAVRLICFFKLKGFSPLHLLKKEIINVRIVSQIEDRDAWRLRNVLELVADYKLELQIPGEVIVKLMVQLQRHDNL